MSYTTPQLDAAAAVATLLTGRTIAGVKIVASSADLLPKYDLEELGEPKIDCVAASPFSFSALDRESAEEEVNINVGIQRRCGRENDDLHRQMKQLARSIARLLAMTRLDGFGRPREDVEVEESGEILETDGRFFAVVSVQYRVVTEGPE